MFIVKFLYNFYTLFQTKSFSFVVVMYVNKVGPYSNPHETYHYYELPICRPEKIVHKSLSLGEVLEGDRMAFSEFKFSFKANTEKEVLCQQTLSKEDVDKLSHAIENFYYFEFVLDDLPLRGFVGHLEETRMIPHTHKIFLWTHFSFVISYNQDQIVSTNVSMKSDKYIRLDDSDGPTDVTFSYSISWVPTTIKYIDRIKLLQDFSIFPKSLEVHWLSVINSMVLVFLLIGFIIVILTRVLRNDFARYNTGNEEQVMDDVDGDDYGWKIIHTDVFRFPQNRTLFCAILGVGMQFLAIVFGIMMLALMGLFKAHNHSSMNTAICILYALTCCIAGYVSASMYKKMGVGYPLTVIGGMVGKNTAGDFYSPCRTKNISREIPVGPWYKSYIVHCFIGGFLPFSAISVELYYIFATVWGRQHYALYGILLVIMFILLSVTALSTGFFVFLYAMFYYQKRSTMSGVLQFTEFFGNTILICYIFFLTLGTVSFLASLKFVRYIYQSIKMD
ncbi:Transmembrane 9 superfamily member 1 [Nymphon striatum]|nr:Transmembrane 9 superfamily member 1 [Nymphon striatum]